MTGALAWTGRLVFLVLAMLATLSIIGSIAAIPSGLAEQRLGIERRQAALPDAPALDRATPAPPPRAPQADDAAGADPQAAGADREAAGADRQVAPPVMAQAEPDDPLLWLEPLTYAVLALAGLLAIAVLLLWRALLALEARG